MKSIRIVYAVLLVVLSITPSTAFSADIAQGKKRAAVCFSCHGENGIAKIAGVPNLAGQHRDYLEKALLAYRGGQLRQDPTMVAMAKPLSDSDITNIATYFSFLAPTTAGMSAAEAVAMYQRIKPAGDVAQAAEATSNAPRDGQTIYNASCMACHGSGAAGAPKIGDKAAWQPRVANGKATLYQHALNGFNAMPAKGGCANCSDDEIKSAVDYLANAVR